MIGAGQLTKRVILQAPSVTKAADGAETVTWTTLSTIWAEIASSGGREFWQAKQANAEISHMVRIRYRARMSPRFRIVHGGRVFQVLSVINPDEGQTDLILLCKEVAQ